MTRVTSNVKVSAAGPAPQGWQGRLAQLIKQAKPDTAHTLQKDCQRVLADAPPEQQKLLAPLPELLNEWINTGSAATSDPLHQWREFYESVKDRVPITVLVAMLKRFPQNQSSPRDWDDFVLACHKPELVEALLAAHLLKPADLNRLAKEHSGAFYESAALDVLVKRHALRETCGTWSQCASARKRRTGLLPREDIVVECHRAMRPPKADEELWLLLLNEPGMRAAVFDRLLDNRDAVRRLLQFGIALCSGNAKSKRIGDLKNLAELISSIIHRCEQSLTQPADDRCLTASLIIADLHLFVAGVALLPDQDIRATLERAIAHASGTAILRALRWHEQGEKASIAVGARSGLLHSVVHEFLGQLGSTTGAASAAENQAGVYQRFLGHKDIIEQLLPALDGGMDEKSLRDTLEAVLFNIGVRKLGNVGEKTKFNFLLHQSENPGTLDGDAVVIIKTGRLLGQGDIVLARATVRLISET